MWGTRRHACDCSHAHSARARTSAYDRASCSPSRPVLRRAPLERSKAHAVQLRAESHAPPACATSCAFRGARAHPSQRRAPSGFGESRAPSRARNFVRVPGARPSKACEGSGHERQPRPSVRPSDRLAGGGGGGAQPRRPPLRPLAPAYLCKWSKLKTGGLLRKRRILCRKNGVSQGRHGEEVSAPDPHARLARRRLCASDQVAMPAPSDPRSEAAPTEAARAPGASTDAAPAADGGARGLGRATGGGPHASPLPHASAAPFVGACSIFVACSPPAGGGRSGNNLDRLWYKGCDGSE